MHSWIHGFMHACVHATSIHTYLHACIHRCIDALCVQACRADLAECMRKGGMLARARTTSKTLHGGRFALAGRPACNRRDMHCTAVNHCATSAAADMVRPRHDECNYMADPRGRTRDTRPQPIWSASTRTMPDLLPDMVAPTATWHTRRAVSMARAALAPSCGCGALEAPPREFNCVA